MGQSEIKREHLRLSEIDFPILEKKAVELMQVILTSFSYSILKDDSWPYRYGIEKNSIQYEFIFSQMGSFTLRLAQSDRYRRNPPPIFYISIGKYENGEYAWEDFSASPVDTAKENLVSLINKSMDMYENSMKGM
jgi:hypothetical protein